MNGPFSWTKLLRRMLPVRFLHPTWQGSEVPYGISCPGVFLDCSSQPGENTLSGLCLSHAPMGAVSCRDSRNFDRRSIQPDSFHWRMVWKSILLIALKRILRNGLWMPWIFPKQKPCHSGQLSWEAWHQRCMLHFTMLPRVFQRLRVRKNLYSRFFSYSLVRETVFYLYSLYPRPGPFLYSGVKRACSVPLI